MKRISLFSAFLLSTCLFSLSSYAQYQDVRADKQGANRPFDQIVELTRSVDANTPSWGGQNGTMLFNFDWRFQLGNPKGAEQTDFDDSAWRKLDLPHDFQFEQPWSEQAGGARGFKDPCEGWYRKHFFVPQEWKGLRVLLDFGGIMYYGDIYVNGHKVAESEYGYLGLETEISSRLNYGGDNVVAVYANSGKPNASRWYTGAGLFRDVRLRLQNATHIGRHGIYVAPEGALVRLTVDVCGFPHGSAPQPVTTVRATVRDVQGTVLGTSSVEVPSLTKHNHDEVALPDIKLQNPKLWDLDNPYLYYVDVDVMVDTLLVDRQTERFGVRSIAYGKDFGFKLNGRKVFLKGMANHHDMGALGAASYDDAIRRQFRQMKRFGFNCLRCSHNPYSESLTRIADEEGILVVDEFIDKWSDNEYWGGRKPFTQIWPNLIREWVTRDRNCPSVILWSLGNELQIRPNWSGYDTNDWGITTYRLLDVMTKRYDSTRPTTVAMFPARAGAIREEKEFKTYNRPPELALATEISSFNYQWDRYPYYFEYAPDMILFQSEAVTNQMQAPFYGMDRERTVGLAYWGAIEYWGESNKWPKKGWNFSFFRHTLWPNPQAWLIKGAFQPEEPVVHIGVQTGSESLGWNAVNVGQKIFVDFWNFDNDTKHTVTAFTNCDEVELFQNAEWKKVKGQWKMVKGVSLGRKTSDSIDVFKRGIIKWGDVDYGQGGSLTAVAYRNGQEVARHRIATAGEAVRLVVEPEANPQADFASPSVPGMSLRYLSVRAVDRNGNTVPSYTEPLDIKINGSGYSLVALDNGDHYTSQLFGPEITTCNMLQGRALVILRSTRTPGKTTIHLSTPTMKTNFKFPNF